MTLAIGSRVQAKIGTGLFRLGARSGVVVRYERLDEHFGRTAALMDPAMPKEILSAPGSMPGDAVLPIIRWDPCSVFRHGVEMPCNPDFVEVVDERDHRDVN
jgi:hypothetical protein